MLIEALEMYTCPWRCRVYYTTACPTPVWRTTNSAVLQTEELPWYVFIVFCPTRWLDSHLHFPETFGCPLVALWAPSRTNNPHTQANQRRPHMAQSRCFLASWIASIPLAQTKRRIALAVSITMYVSSRALHYRRTNHLREALRPNRGVS